MKGLREKLFDEFSSKFASAVNSISDIELGGLRNDGNFKLHFIATTVAPTSCGLPPATDPAFGFIFSTTLKAAFGSTVEVNISQTFSARRISIGSGNTIFESIFYPFEDVGTCFADELTKSITVSVNTPAGITADSNAKKARNIIVCNLFEAVQPNQSWPFLSAPEGRTIEFSIRM